MQTLRIAIDRGGTFTDVYAIRTSGPNPEDEPIVLKLLSVDPQNYEDAPSEGIRRVLDIVNGTTSDRHQKIDLKQIESIRMGTTVATNALLERTGEKVALLTTKGYRDILRIGQQARPNIFDLSVRKLALLFETVVEINERVTIETFTEDPEPSLPDVESDPDLAVGRSGDIVRIIKRLETDLITEQLQDLWQRGFRSLAICLLHSYAYSDHENIIADIARKMGFQVSVSSELQPMIKIVNRANSAVADAYLSPVIRRYIEKFSLHFNGGLNALESKLLFMQSDGGLCKWDLFSGLRAILSGPAGGVVGLAQVAYNPVDRKPILGFDMGGTSTDVCRFDGRMEHVFDTVTAEVVLQTPQLDINTVAAGGGSQLSYRHGLFAAGPDSAGAHPGPACYRKGGPLTLTDANLFLGRLLPEFFPSIFGENEDRPLDTERTAELFNVMAKSINEERKPPLEPLSPEQVALGFVQVANETMTRPMRTLTEGRGFETKNHNLCVFGGAGGQHACTIASSLGISRVIVSRFSSILSAFGMAYADVVVEAQEPDSFTLGDMDVSSLKRKMASLVDRVTITLRNQGFDESSIDAEMYLNCRYDGSDTRLMVLKPDGEDNWNFEKEFIALHKALFGFVLEKTVYADDLRVRGTGRTHSDHSHSYFGDLKKYPRHPVASKPAITKNIYFENTGWAESRVFLWNDLMAGDQIEGPGVIVDNTQTILIEPGSIATLLPHHVIIDIKSSSSLSVSKPIIDPITLSVFGHRFMSIAEQMGQVLRQEKLGVTRTFLLPIDPKLLVSCALFSPDGGLTANAPHVPCHLGAMSHAVRYQAKVWNSKLVPGDVLVSNHPIAGGSHLPDITVMTPVFDGEGRDIIFWAASRGHHADIGGISAGSMPPFSREIWEEGAMIESFKLVREGVFDEEGIVDLLYVKPSQYSGCSGTRTLKDNISDLKAQVAANSKGVALVQALVKEYSLKVVQMYMLGVQENAEHCVRELLKATFAKFSGAPLKAVEYMDNGARINLEITIKQEDGSATFDFTGTSRQLYGNLNAPTAITYSAIIYVLRSLIKADIPLNQGSLNPISVIMPEGTMLSPSAEAATVGGNVDTSQRVTDVILRAFEACGASQGTCNNLTFGFGGTSADGKVRKGFGYYETIAGGAGAGPTWHGQSGVHVHMTNTRIGDPELFERSYPVLLHEFSIREGSGGKGQYNGGDGCVRDIEFRHQVDLAILSERRVHAPYGICGGEPGKVGENFWIRNYPNEKRTIFLGGMNTCQMEIGDRIIIHTPGGGGFGNPGKKAHASGNDTNRANIPRANGSVAEYQATQVTA